MAKVRVTLDTRSNSQDKEGKFPLVLRISHKSKTRDIPFNIHVHEGQFDENTTKITGIQNSVRHSKRVQKIYGDVDLWIDENKAEIKLWDIAKLKDQVEKEFFNKQSELLLFEFAGTYFDRFHLKEKFSTISSYEDALKVLAKFNMKQKRKSDKVIIKSLYDWDERNGYQVKEEYQEFDMHIKAIDRGYAKRFEAYMSNRFNSKNTVFIHLRSLQAIISDAADTYDDLKDHAPFEKIPKTSFSNNPVVLSKKEIQMIRGLKSEFNQASGKYDAINYFLFMFNNMGMNFMDIALAKVHWFDGERLKYTRKKTSGTQTKNGGRGDVFSIKQNQENLEIIEHYSKGKGADEYLFPIIPDDTPEERIFRIKNHKAKWFNKHFTSIASQLGIEKNITTYTARDTWTNMGLDMGIDIRQISKGLGHAKVETTEKHYEAGIQYRLLDEMNSIITALE